MYGSGSAEPSTTSSLSSETLIGLAGWNEGGPFWNGYSVCRRKQFREMLYSLSIRCFHRLNSSSMYAGTTKRILTPSTREGRSGPPIKITEDYSHSSNSWVVDCKS